MIYTFFSHFNGNQWTIEVDYGHLVEIKFTDYDFEASEDCMFDGLIVRLFHLIEIQLLFFSAFSTYFTIIQVSNDEKATKVINKFCGVKHNEHESIVTSSGNRVYVHFFSDLSYAGRGFHATYKSIPAKCGGNFTMLSGNITSPNYPNNYNAHTYCQWLLRTEPSHSILFKFSDFELEPDCATDTVQIYDGSEISGNKLLFKKCGTHATAPSSANGTGEPGLTESLKSTGNVMLIVMESDYALQARGFAAQYSTVCPVTIVTKNVK